MSSTDVKEDVKTKEPKNKTRVRAILGIMTWGPGGQTKKDIATKQLKALLDSESAHVKKGPEKGKLLIDTARAYQSGESEQLLGEILRENNWRDRVSIHTKAISFITPLNREGLHSQCNASLKALGIDKIDIFYLHSPDIKTPIEETLAACQELHKAGKFTELGLSNYAAWDVVRIYSLCQTKGWIVPTVYQGMYNAITRSMEAELMPALKTYGIRSYWYNPLGGGFLTGKYTSLDQKLTEGRFSSAYDFVSPNDTTNPMKGIAHKLYRQRYWKQKLFDSLEVIRETCEKEKITMADAAIRWVVHHSVLNGNYDDGILFGASSLAHAEANLKSYAADELPKTITDAFDSAWQVAAPEAESYFRGYGSTPGSSDAYLAQF